MRKIISIQNKIILVDDQDFEYLNQYRWGVSANGYARRFEGDRKKRKCILMHRLINNTPKGFDTDHVNRNKLDNRRENLRNITKIGNLMNTGLWKHNTSGEKGVCWDKKKNKWMARIQINYKFIFLGYFFNIQDAVLARKEGERKYCAI